MKRLPLLLLILATASCQIAEVDKAPEKKMKEMTFIAKGETSTKTALSEDDHILWIPGDEINIFDICATPEQGACFTSDITGPSRKATFTGTIPESVGGYFAVYPFEDYTNDTDYGFLDLDDDGMPETFRLNWAGTNQLATPGSFKNDKAMLVAKANGEELEFKNVFAYISVSTTFPCDKITIEGANDEKLGCSDVYIVWKDGLPVASCALAAKLGNSVNILKPDSDGPIVPGQYVFAVLPQTLANGFTLTFTNPDGSIKGTFEKSTTKSVTLSRGKILDLGTFSTEDFCETGEWNGSGTASDPYQITSLEQLRLLGERVNGTKGNQYRSKHYQLTNDINCNKEWLYCIGNYDERCFEGTFDGNGHRIYNYIAGACYEASGLFGYVKNATIKNLTVEVTGLKTRDGYGEMAHSFSPLVAFALSDNGGITTIENVDVKMYETEQEIVFSTWDCRIAYGSIVGWAGGSVKILSCNASVNVKLDAHSKSRMYYDYNIGGMVGIVWQYYEEGYCIIDRCRNTGNLTVEYLGETNGGGIIGCDDDQNEDATTRITNCVNEGDILLNSSGQYTLYLSESFAGGIIGQHDSDGDYSNGDPFIYNCLNKGKILSNGSESRSGGIMGYCYDNDTDIYCCVNTGEIRAGHDPHIGALCGNDNGVYCYCRWNTANPSGYILPMVADDDDYESTGCSAVNAYTASTLNLDIAKIPANPGKYTYCSWYVSAGDGLPDLLLD